MNLFTVLSSQILKYAGSVITRLTMAKVSHSNDRKLRVRLEQDRRSLLGATDTKETLNPLSGAIRVSADALTRVVCPGPCSRVKPSNIHVL